LGTLWSVCSTRPAPKNGSGTLKYPECVKTIFPWMSYIRVPSVLCDLNSPQWTSCKSTKRLAVLFHSRES
jgi:hypothetical protein